MANIARLKTWNLNETLTSADLNAEFDNILSGTNNGSLDSDNIDQTDTYTWSGNHTFNSLVTHGANLTVGVDDTGHDVKFFGATTGSPIDRKRRLLEQEGVRFGENGAIDPACSYCYDE